ncbi:uncharacterized protein LOC132286034 [Cornus florida]|uniref:uncharacterized protein LOC132286034 n=1 Tax=Cornus florida TaxID=4283 RepID=UPI00289CE1A2|nr:uncharacterized protein LOC132286034 [Cornus florida]XP_059644272.1 uncharacterized protein LOC132286034 [Cornus florida]
MDANSESILQGMPQSTVLGHTNGALAIDQSDLPAVCSLCHRSLSPDNEAGDLEAITICGDCKYLFLEDLGTPIQDRHRRRTPRVRRTRHSSSESIENIFSQQFSHMISLARQNQHTVAEHENQSLDGDTAARSMQHVSSRTTPSGSRRWRRVLSDTESDGFDSLYGENESNVSFSGYRLFHGESDTISYSAYGGESDASVDGHSFLDTEIFANPNAGSDFDSDTDIDPMRAGLNQWNSDDQEEEEEEEEEEDTEWEEAERSMVEISRVGAPHGSLLSSRERNGLENWRRQLHSPEFEGTIRWRFRERRQTYIPNMYANLEESGVPPYVGNSGDYLDARGFEELLEQLAETDSSRRGAPPASVSFVNSLPRVIINEEHDKQNGLACAICKEFLSIGTVVNRLPCFHLYHPSCILPWLSARNSCPLCRYELPTDDRDYEEGKQNATNESVIHEIEQQGMSDDSSSDIMDDAEAEEACEFSHGRSEQGELINVDHARETSGRERARGRWFFLAAAPIVSIVGVVLVLWLGNPLKERRGSTGGSNFPQPGQHLNRLPSQRENRCRRWWSLF